MKIEDLPIAVKAILGKAELPLAAYHALQVGDILILDQEVGQPLSVAFGEDEMVVASPGLFETKKAVRIDGKVHVGRD